MKDIHFVFLFYEGIFLEDYLPPLLESVINRDLSNYIQLFIWNIILKSSNLLMTNSIAFGSRSVRRNFQVCYSPLAETSSSSLDLSITVNDYNTYFHVIIAGDSPGSTNFSSIFRSFINVCLSSTSEFIHSYDIVDYIFDARLRYKSQLLTTILYA